MLGLRILEFSGPIIGLRAQSSLRVALYTNILRAEVVLGLIEAMTLLRTALVL